MSSKVVRKHVAIEPTSYITSENDQPHNFITQYAALLLLIPPNPFFYADAWKTNIFFSFLYSIFITKFKQALNG